MDKQVIGIIIVVLLVASGLGSMLSSRDSAAGNDIGQGAETTEEMNARMHPVQAASSDMSSHHGGSAPSSDRTNADISRLSFSGAVGQAAPDFTLTKQDGSSFKLSDYKDKTVVLFFNEGSMCYPACWNQMASLGNDNRFNTNEVISASIVVDAKSQWDKIISSQPKYGAGTILFDSNKAVSSAYGVLSLASSMHKGSLPGHSYVVIKKGKISYVLDDPNMALNNNLLSSKL